MTFKGEAWGLTHDDQRLIMSDGSSELRFLDPVTFKELGRLPVTDNGLEIAYLNELEFMKGEIYATVRLTDRIAIIDPASGRVSRWIDLSALRSRLVLSLGGRGDESRYGRRHVQHLDFRSPLTRSSFQTCSHGAKVSQRGDNDLRSGCAIMAAVMAPVVARGVRQEGTVCPAGHDHNEPCTRSKVAPSGGSRAAACSSA
jgi:hypothetical protein